MKIPEFELPEWAQERHISIMAGMELLAYKRFGENTLHIKIVRCNWCGWCCCGKFARKMEIDKDDDCIHLKQIGLDFECSLSTGRPWRCSWYDPVLAKFPDAKKYCCVRYMEIEVK